MSGVPGLCWWRERTGKGGGERMKAAVWAAEGWLKRCHAGVFSRISSSSSITRDLKTTATAAAAEALSSQCLLAACSQSFKPPFRLLLRPASRSPSLFSLKLFSTARLFSTPSFLPGRGGGSDETEGEESSDGWEEEEEVEPKLGDGGDGGGIVLGGVAWGERALSIAREVLLQFDDTDMFAFKMSPKGYIYVRLDKLTNKYGCPSMEEIENFSNIYKRQLDEMGERGEIPDDLALEVSSPGAERLLKVPTDLNRFKDVPMWVYYVEEDQNSERHAQKEKVLLLESIDTEAGLCVWKLADVKENRADLDKGRRLNKKQKDWRLTLSFKAIEKATLYLDSKD